MKEPLDRQEDKSEMHLHHEHSQLDGSSNGTSSSAVQNKSIWTWWRIEDDELEAEVTEYHSRSPFKGAKAVSAYLLIFSGILTLALSSTLEQASKIDAGICFILAGFVFRGNRLAIILAMVYWTFAKGSYIVSALPSMYSVVAQLVWWSIYMNRFWKALAVERRRKALDEESELASNERGQRILNERMGYVAYLLPVVGVFIFLSADRTSSTERVEIATSELTVEVDRIKLIDKAIQVSLLTSPPIFDSANVRPYFETWYKLVEPRTLLLPSVMDKTKRLIDALVHNGDTVEFHAYQTLVELYGWFLRRDSYYGAVLSRYPQAELPLMMLQKDSLFEVRRKEWPAIDSGIEAATTKLKEYGLKEE